MQVTPWCLSLSCTSTSTIYFQTFGMISAIIFLFASMTCLYSSPLMCVNKLASCFGALSFDNHLEMHVSKGSIFSILSSASCLPSVGFGVTS